MTLFATVIVTSLRANLACAAEKPNRHIKVYLRDDAQVPTMVRVRATGLATKIFASIDVKVDWHLGTPPAGCTNGTLAIELTKKTPATLFPGAMAVAWPHEGLHIRLFYDRIEQIPSAVPLLAHVLVP